MLHANIRYKFDDLRGSFLNYHSKNWVNPESPTPLELQESVKSEVCSWLDGLGIHVHFDRSLFFYDLNASEDVASLVSFLLKSNVLEYNKEQVIVFGEDSIKKIVTKSLNNDYGNHVF